MASKTASLSIERETTSRRRSAAAGCCWRGAGPYDKVKTFTDEYGREREDLHGDVALVLERREPHEQAVPPAAARKSR